MQGAGNDFVVLNGFHEPVHMTRIKAQKIADRHFGVGCDQILIAEKSAKADFFMRIYNADGGEVEMCGNGIRAIALFARDQGICPKNHQKIETPAGVKTVEILNDNLVQVEMGGAYFSDVADFPDDFIAQEVTENFKGTCVSVGNPHCVIFVDNVEDFPVEMVGREVENLGIFPNRINTEFVEVVTPTELKMRVWERGSGETLACGTGATASAIAAIKNGLSPAKEDITVHLKGGDLTISWDQEKNLAKMRGGAEYVFEGTLLK